MLQLKIYGNTEDERRLSMVAVTAQLWIFIHYFHPDTEKRHSWEKAFKILYPKITVGLTNQQFAGLVQEMLEHLGDPATCLRQSRTQPSYSWFQKSWPTA